MIRRSRTGAKAPELTSGDRGGRQPNGATPSRRPGLQPVSALPSRAKLFLVVACLAIVGFAVWITIHLLDTDSRPLAILLILLAYVGATVVGIAVVTATRMLFSLRAMPYLLGRGLRRLLTRR